MDLHLDDDLLSECVQCGLCLPHCPTFRVTGEEARSPRGRIAAMREVQRIGLEPDAAWLDAMDSCVQCRACEPACPSGVEFGRLIETTRSTLVETGRLELPRWTRIGVRLLDHRRILGFGVAMLVALRRLPGATRLLDRSATTRRISASVPKSRPLRQPPLRVAGWESSAESGEGSDEVWLMTGCVMDAVQREVHQATVDVLEAVGYRVRVPSHGAGCCGALATHLGYPGIAREQAASLMARFPGDAPVAVDAAGCGAQLLDVDHLGGTRASAFAARVVDASELVARRIERLPSPLGERPRVAIQDPCHLRHVQRTHGALRTVLASCADVVELDDDGMCCGAGGAYAQLCPDDAASIRERKLAAVVRADAELVVTANPGCELHLRDGGVEIEHVMVTLSRLAGLARPVDDRRAAAPHRRARADGR